MKFWHNGIFILLTVLVLLAGCSQQPSSTPLTQDIPRSESSSSLPSVSSSVPPVSSSESSSSSSTASSGSSSSEVGDEKNGAEPPLGASSEGASQAQSDAQLPPPESKTEDSGGSSAENVDEEYIEKAYVDEVHVEPVTVQEVAAIIVDAAPAVPTVLTPQAPGIRTDSNEGALIDYSNTEDGYVMVKYNGAAQSRLKVLIKGPSTTYTYNLTENAWTAFPLSEGNGYYQVGVYRNVSGTKYATVLSTGMQVSLNDQFAPFLRPNQYVDYREGSKVVELGSQIVSSSDHALKKVEKVYDYVVANLSYDYQKAANVKSGYLPVLDQVLQSKKGICFDYAALMTALLRSQNVPCKLMVGYAGQTYHAWINVWTQESGWVDGAIFFNGSVWKRMDPTYASSGAQSAAIMDFISRDVNYTVKYQY